MLQISLLDKLMQCIRSLRLCLIILLIVSLIESSRASILPMRNNLSGNFPPSIADKIEPIFSASMNRVRLQQQNMIPPVVDSIVPTRSPFLDTLFNIPISSLQVMNEFAQTMAVGLQKISGAFGYPVRFPAMRPSEVTKFISPNIEA